MSDTMLAAVLYGAKDLRWENYPRPSLEPGMVQLQVRRVGICGSDLHYFQHGCCGAFVPTRPFVLGHELVGEVVGVGDSVNEPLLGARVTVNPARACGVCEYCRSGRGNLCRKTIMLGSASTVPPTDGAFAEFLNVRADQCHVLPPILDDGLGAMLEPFAVALHAAKRAGSISGKRVLIQGGGPIGLLVLLTARAFGAAPVVICDPVARRRQTALTLGADAVLDPAEASLPRQACASSDGGFDVVFEASGAPAALRLAFELVRPGGTIVQIGTLGTQAIPLPANQLMVREIQLLGSFRYGNVFDEAIRLAAFGRVNLKPLTSQVLPLRQAAEAMVRALDKDNVLKVQMENPSA